MSTKKACPLKRYRDEIEAKLALAVIRRRDSSLREQTPERAYFCPHCHGWHLSRNKKG